MTDRLVEEVRGVLEADLGAVVGPSRIEDLAQAVLSRLAELDAPGDDLDGAECHELYSLWLAHNAAEGVHSQHPLVTGGEKLARRMDAEHPRFAARLDAPGPEGLYPADDLKRENARLRRGLWDCALEAGVGGNTTPDHLAQSDIVDYALRAVRELREAYE